MEKLWKELHCQASRKEHQETQIKELRQITGSHMQEYRIYGLQFPNILKFSA